VIVHRLLAVAVAADASYPELLDKHRSQVCVFFFVIYYFTPDVTGEPLPNRPLAGIELTTFGL
jgi:hypothetical protein